MNAAQRREGRLALAMLPMGATVLVVSVVGTGLILLFAAMLLATGVLAPGPWLWSAFALAVGFWNMRSGIAMMSAFDWRPLPLTSMLSVLVVAGWRLLP